MADHDPLLSFNETARALNIPIETLRDWICRKPKPNERPHPKRDKVRALTKIQIEPQDQTVKIRPKQNRKYLFKESEVLKLKEQLKTQNKPKKGWGSSRHI